MRGAAAAAAALAAATVELHRDHRGCREVTEARKTAMLKTL
jgi:hypothetical protein